MRSFKQVALILTSALLLTILAACGSSSAGSTTTKSSNGDLTIRIGTVSTPHGEILQYIKDNLAAKEHLNIEITEFTDYVQPNTALQQGQIDANYFQHVPYMQDFNKQHGMNMVAVAKVHIEPLGIYSKKIKSLSQLPNNAVVAVPNDTTNEGRALALLAANKIITLKSGIAPTSATPGDITSNPKNVQIKELEAAQLPRSLDDTSISVINGNYALSSGLTPSKDALALESATNNPYANVLAVLKGHENDPAVQKLAKLLTSPEVKQFILNKYKGSVIPAF